MQEVEQVTTEVNLSLKGILDNLEDEILIIDSSYRVIFANSAARKRKADLPVLCYEIHGRDTPCYGPLWDCPLEKVLKEAITTTVIHSDKVKCLKITMYPLCNTSTIVEIRRDISTERWLETQLKKHHHQILALSQISNAVSRHEDLDAIMRKALDNVLDLTDGVIGEILLFDGGEGLFRHLRRGPLAKYAEKLSIFEKEEIRATVVQTGMPIVLLDISEDPNAVSMGIRKFISIPLKTADRVVGILNIASNDEEGVDDLSILTSVGSYLGTAVEQVKLNERLMKMGERHRALLQHTLTAQEEERKRIARELHDETSQAFTSLTLNLQALIQLAEIKGIRDAELIGGLRVMHSWAVRAGNEVVKLMKELRPALLDELGLAAAIFRYAKDTLQTQGINVSMELRCTDHRFPPEVEVTLFRIAQGAIGNILEHSGAKNVLIEIEGDATWCTLYINDDGKGFNVSKITQVEPSGRGAGLFNMEERAKLIGGVCHVTSRIGKGTTVVVRIPVEEEGVADEENNGTYS
jgi:signal transduction histidine kinase